MGGIAGGSILQGILKVGDEIEVRPGVVSRDNGKLLCVPIKSKILSLFAESNQLTYAVPGGLIGVGTNIDPTLCRADRLVGQVLGEGGQLPDIFTEIEVNFFLLRQLLGVSGASGRQSKVSRLSKGEVLIDARHYSAHLPASIAGVFYYSDADEPEKVGQKFRGYLARWCMQEPKTWDSYKQVIGALKGRCKVI